LRLILQIIGQVARPRVGGTGLRRSKTLRGDVDVPEIDLDRQLVAVARLVIGH
jgi:hypothetical protein